MIPENFLQLLEERIALVEQGVPGSIGAQMAFRVTQWDGEAVTMICQTFPWMRNFAGTLHGGMCATIVDQAMGFVSNALKGGKAVVPTVQLSVNYHRPLVPGEEVVVKVQIIGAGRSLITLRSEAANGGAQEKVCISATGTYFYKAEA